MAPTGSGTREAPVGPENAADVVGVQRVAAA